MRYVVPNLVLFFTLSLASVPLSGATIPVFGTGLSPLGTFLAVGATDPHYTLTLNPLGTGMPEVPSGASPSEVTVQGVPLGWPLLPGVWAGDNLAQWIAPQVDIVGIPGTGSLSYFTYQTTFNLNGFDLSTVQLTGHWTADNWLAQVSLNGTPIATPGNGCGSFPNWAFASTIPFTISSGFQGGVNTLDFNVTNGTCNNTPPQPNPTGLLVDISGFGDLTVPEPGTMLPAAAGLALAAWFYRLRRKIRA